MKISLKRFIQKNVSPETLTFKEAKEKMTAIKDYKKVPTIRNLQSSDEVILYQFKVLNKSFELLKNGLICCHEKVQTDEGMKIRSTVIPVYRSRLFYCFCTDENLDMSCQLDDAPFQTAIELLAIERLQQNSDEREKTRVPVRIDEADWSELTSVHDFVQTMEDRYQERVQQERKQLRLEKLKQALSALTPKQKEVVEMYYFQNMTQEKISCLLGLSRSAVEDRLQGALKKLRKIVS